MSDVRKRAKSVKKPSVKKPKAIKPANSRPPKKKNEVKVVKPVAKKPTAQKPQPQTSHSKPKTAKKRVVSAKPNQKSFIKTALGKDGKLYYLKLIDGGKELFKKKKFVRIFICAVLIFAVLIINFSTPTGLPESLTNTFAGFGSSGEIPFKQDGSRIIYAKTYGGKLFSLSDTSFCGYTASGGKFLDITHGFTSPACAFSSSRMLITNSLSNKYIITNYKNKLYSGTTENTIVCSNIAENGNYVFVTKATGYEAAAVVYNSSNKKIYEWCSSANPISAAALSYGGNRLVVSAISSQGGEIISNLYCFAFNSANPITQFSEKGVVLDIAPISNGCYAVTFKDKVVYYNYKRGELGRIEKSGNNICYFKYRKGGENIVVSTNGIISNSYNVYYNKNERTKKQFVFDQEVLDADVLGGRIYLLLNKKVVCLNTAGKIIESYALKSPASSLYVLSRGNIYVSNEISFLKPDKEK